MSERGGIMKIRNLTKKMDDNLVLKDVSFDLKAGGDYCINWPQWRWENNSIFNDDGNLFA